MKISVLKNENEFNSLFNIAPVSIDKDTLVYELSKKKSNKLYSEDQIDFIINDQTAQKELYLKLISWYSSEFLSVPVGFSLERLLIIYNNYE